MLFYIYPIVPYASAFLHSFLLLVTVVKGIYTLASFIFLLRGTGIFLVLFYIYPIVATLRISIFCTVHVSNCTTHYSHLVSFNGNSVISDHHRTDSRALFPAHSGTVMMQADNPGTWLMECQVTDHFKAGMFAFYNVNDTCGKPVNGSSETGITKHYYIAAEEVEWDYGPTGYDSFDGSWLNKTGR